jgi:fucose permease
MWVLTPSFFWASLLIGRSVAPLFLGRIQENQLSRIGLIAALLGVSGCLAAHNAIALAIATCLAGLGLSSVFPIAIAALSHKFGNMASRIAGLMFNLAGLGGATLPWLVGLTSSHTGNLKFGLVVPFLGCAAMLLLNLPLEPRRNRPVPA